MKAPPPQILRTVSKTSEIYTFQCAASRTIDFTSKNTYFLIKGPRKYDVGNDKCWTVGPPRPVREVGNIFSEAKWSFYAGKTPTFYMARFDAYLHALWAQSSKEPCPRMKMRGAKTSTSDLARETPEPPNLTCIARCSPRTVR